METFKTYTMFFFAVKKQPREISSLDKTDKFMGFYKISVPISKYASIDVVVLASIRLKQTIKCFLPFVHLKSM